MTAALAHHVDRLDFLATPGVSPRAIRAILKMMSKIANDAGEFRYGLRGSKLASLTDYSLSVVRRAQKHLVDQGYIERLEVGGGRASTKWKIVVDKLASNHSTRHTSSDTEVQQAERPDTAQGHYPKFYPEMNPIGSPRKNQPSESVASVIDQSLCDHGFPAGLLPSGTHRCPTCRRTRRPDQGGPSRR